MLIAIKRRASAPGKGATSLSCLLFLRFLCVMCFLARRGGRPKSFIAFCAFARVKVVVNFNYHPTLWGDIFEGVSFAPLRNHKVSKFAASARFKTTMNYLSVFFLRQCALLCIFFFLFFSFFAVHERCEQNRGVFYSRLVDDIDAFNYSRWDSRTCVSCFIILRQD